MQDQRDENGERIKAFEEEMKKCLVDVVEEYSVHVFQTEAHKPEWGADKWQPFGILKIGLVFKTFHGNKKQVEGNYIRVFYTPEESETDKKNPPKEVNLSYSTILLESSPARYRKEKDPCDQYFFEIVVDESSGVPQFMGKFTVNNIPYAWRSKSCREETRSETQRQISVKAPNDLKGNFTVLKNLSPCEHRTQITDGKETTVLVDKARENGDEIIGKLMINALDDETKTHLIHKIPSLTAPERKILEKNSEFLHRAGIHAIAEQLKDSTFVDENIRKRIEPRYLKFLEMLVHYEDKPVTQSKDSSQDTSQEHAKAYGWDSQKHKEQIERLQRQYFDVVAATYVEGYKAFRPEWSDFMSQPGYWFDVLSVYITRSDTVKKFQLASTIPGSVEFQQAKRQAEDWTQNLNVLKAAAAEKGEKRDIELVLGAVKKAQMMALTEAQVWDKDMKERVVQFAKYLQNSDYKGFEEMMGIRAEKYATDLTSSADHIKEAIAQIDVLFAERIAHYWASRNSLNNSSSLSVGQLIESIESDLEMVDLTASSTSIAPNPALSGSNSTPNFGKVLLGWTKKSAMTAMKSTIVLVRLYSLYSLIELLHQNDKNALETGYVISLLTAEAVSLGASVGSALLNCWGRGQVYMRSLKLFSTNLQQSTNILSRSAGVLFTTVPGILSVFCFIGCVFEASCSFSDLKDALKDKTSGRERYLYYTAFRFAIAVSSLITTGALIIGMILNFPMLVSFCPFVAVGLSIVGVIGTYFFAKNFEKPDDYIEKFLEENLKDMGGFPEAKSDGHKSISKRSIHESEEPQQQATPLVPPTSIEPTVSPTDQLQALVDVLSGRIGKHAHSSWI